MIRLRRRTEDGHSLLLKLIKSSGTFVLQLRATGPIRAQSQEFLKCEALSAHLSWSIQVIPKKCSLFGYVQWSCYSTDLCAPLKHLEMHLYRLLIWCHCSAVWKALLRLHDDQCQDNGHRKSERRIVLMQSPGPAYIIISSCLDSTL